MKQYGFELYSVGEKFERVLSGEGGTFETRDNMCECTITLSNITDCSKRQSKDKIKFACFAA